MNWVDFLFAEDTMLGGAHLQEALTAALVFIRQRDLQGPLVQLCSTAP